MEFAIEDRTDKVHPQQMSFSSIAVPFAHDLKRFNPRINVFNDDSFTRQISVKSLLLRCQRMILTFLVRNLAIFVQI